jgi:SNF2 family DNA or RNA helicase
MFGMIRRTKKECLDLPPMLIQLKQAQLSVSAQKLYDATFRELRESYRKRVAAGKISDQGEHLALLTHYLHAQSLAKAETAAEVAEDVLQTGRSVVIYANYTATIDRIREILGQGEVLTGQTTEKRRAVNMARFQAGESRVFLSTIRAGGEGVTLTAAQDIILVDRSWVPDDAAQVQDRINRIGQLGNSITATWIQFGLDSDIDRLLIEKQQNSNWALAGQRPRFGGGGVRDIAVLLAELFGS